jgi:Ca2+-binding EF-hand superfamily protein
MEIPVHKKYLSAIIKKFDEKGKGSIEFDTFLNHVLYNPYK